VTIDQDTPRLRLIKTEEQIGDGRFSSPGGTNQCDPLTRLDPE
jgi:hypothetical protein